MCDIYMISLGVRIRAPKCLINYSLVPIIINQSIYIFLDLSLQQRLPLSSEIRPERDNSF